MVIKKRFVIITFVLCSILLWKPVHAQAAEQTVANLVLMVNFDGDGNNVFTTAYRDVMNMYDTSDVSGVHSYISAISDGQVDVENFFPQDCNGNFQAITLSGSAEDYAYQNDAVFIGAVMAEMDQLLQAGKLTMLSGEQLDTWQNDRQRLDGCIDNITFLVQTSSNDGIFYPHAAGYGGDLTLYGKKVAQYNIVPSPSLMITQYGCDGYAVVAHEFLHSLGAPDLYRTGGNYVKGQPVGIWDEMAEVAPHGASYPLTYTRKDLGWLEIPTITQSGDYKLQPATDRTGNRAYILKTSKSDSEFFVIEYRPNRGLFEYDSFYTSMSSYVQGGLLVYRVNTSVENHTNVRGENYIYVFRPGTAGEHEAAMEQRTGNPNENAVRDAAITPTGSRTSLGSADLNAPCTEDTIFYADGSNSGIVINNVSFNADGTASFHAEFPILKEEEYWQMQGSSVSGLQWASLDGSGDGSRMYLTGIKYQNYQWNLVLYTYDSTSGNWKELQSINAYPGYTDILYTDDGVYVAYSDTSGRVNVARYDNGSWVSCYMSGNAVNKAKLMQQDGKVWVSYYGGKEIYLADVTSNVTYSPLTVPDNVTNPEMFYAQGKWYAVYSNFRSGSGTGDEKGRVACYENGIWTPVYEIKSLEKMLQSDSCVIGNNVYLVAVDDSGNAIYLTWDGSNWTEQTLNDIKVTNGVRLVVKDQIPYILWVENSTLKAKYLKNGVWTELANMISSDAQDFDVFCGGNTLYVATSSSGGNVSVRKMKTVEGTPDPIPQPTVGSGNVVLALPAGYDSSAKLYIDGVEFSSTAWQNDESKRLVSIGSTGQSGAVAQTAMVCQYNASGIPTGMYVWRLSAEGDHYTATAIPEFENLFSYHGFSVRYTGNTGLRCTYGIDSTKKEQLISDSGLNGYRITEMGTLIMRPDNHAGNPMVYGSNKVSGGRTYWVQNGRVNNKVIRKVNGRDQFANVLTNLPPNRYNTAYFFRPYAVMSYNGGNVVIYGPEMSRSMYTVCKQILSRGDFKPGTSGYQFLKNIVDSVENK